MIDIETSKFDPKTCCAGVMYKNSRLDKAGYALKVKELRDVRNFPFLLTKRNSLEAVAVFAQACFFKFPPVLNSHFSDGLWQASSLDDIGNLLTDNISSIKNAARENVGTHTCKMPNPSVKSPVAVFADENVSKNARNISYLSSFTLKDDKVVSGAGGASSMPAQRFLSGSFTIDGLETLSIYEDLAAQGLVYQALQQLGVQERELVELSDIIGRKLNSGIDSDPGAYSKTLIWPCGDEGDVALTPLHPFIIQKVISSRLASRYQDGRIVENTPIKIGGSKPQNGGLMNNAHGGWVRKIVSIPPKVLQSDSRKLFSHEYGQSLRMSKIGRTHPAIERFIRIVKSKKNNMDARNELNQSIQFLATVLIEPWLVISNAVRNMDRQALAFMEKFSVVQRMLLTDGYAIISQNGKSVIVEEIVEAFFETPHGIDHPDLRALVAAQVDELLQRRF